MVGTPDITDVHFHDGEPLRFKAEFEVVPEIELGEYKDVEVPLPRSRSHRRRRRQAHRRAPRAEGATTSTSIRARSRTAITPWSRSKAWPASKAIRSRRTRWCSKSAAPIRCPASPRICAALTPGEEKDFEVTYPEDYGSTRAGRQDGEVPRHAEGHAQEGTAGIERRVRAGPGRFPRPSTNCARPSAKASSRSASTRRSRKPRTRSSTSWWMRTIFRCPRSSSNGRSRTAWSRACAPWRRRGRSAAICKLDWEKVKESQREKAVREVKASLLLVARSPSGKPFTPPAMKSIRKWSGSPASSASRVAAVQMRFEKDGTLGRIANHIQTEKTLNFLFEHARKTAEVASGLGRGMNPTSGSTPVLNMTNLRSTLLRKPVQVIIETKSDGWSLPRRQPVTQRRKRRKLREACRIR